MGTAKNQNKLFMRMASKFMGKTDGDYYTLDDMFVSKAAEREHFGEEERTRGKKLRLNTRVLLHKQKSVCIVLTVLNFPNTFLLQ